MQNDVELHHLLTGMEISSIARVVLETTPIQRSEGALGLILRPVAVALPRPRVEWEPPVFPRRKIVALILPPRLEIELDMVDKFCVVVVVVVKLGLCCWQKKGIVRLKSRDEKRKKGKKTRKFFSAGKYTVEPPKKIFFLAWSFFYKNRVCPSVILLLYKNCVSRQN